MATTYGPAVTGIMLAVATSWIVLDVVDTDDEVDLSGAIVVGIVGTLALGLLWGVLALVAGVLWGPVSTVLLTPASRLETGPDLLVALLEGVLAGAGWPIGVVVGVLRWIPIEVATVLFALGFLTVVTGGDE